MLFPISTLLHSGVVDELVKVGLRAWSPCTGVGRRQRVVLGGGGWCLPRVSRVWRWLWVLWMPGGRTELELPATAIGVDGELGSWIEGARGVAPADGLIGDGLFYCGSCQSIHALGPL